MKLLSLEVDGLEFRFPARLSYATTVSFLLHRAWFEPEWRWMERWLDPGDHVIDAGCAFGAYATRWARAVGDRGVVLAVDMQSDMVDSLCPSDVLQPYLGVLSDVAGVPTDTGPWTLDQRYIEVPEGRQAGAGGGAPVLSVTLDGLIERFELTPNLIKLDLEGAELAALNGGKRMLARLRPVVMLELVRNGHVNLDAVERVLRDGYSASIYSAHHGLALPTMPGRPRPPPPIRDELEWLAARRPSNVVLWPEECVAIAQAKGLLLERGAPFDMPEDLVERYVALLAMQWQDMAEESLRELLGFKPNLYALISALPARNPLPTMSSPWEQVIIRALALALGPEHVYFHRAASLLALWFHAELGKLWDSPAIADIRPHLEAIAEEARNG